MFKFWSRISLKFNIFTPPVLNRFTISIFDRPYFIADAVILFENVVKVGTPSLNEAKRIDFGNPACVPGDGGITTT